MNQMGRLFGVVCFASTWVCLAEPIAIFSFDSNPADNAPGTGTNVASFGAGSVQGLVAGAPVTIRGHVGSRRLVRKLAS